MAQPHHTADSQPIKAESRPTGYSSRTDGFDHGPFHNPRSKWFRAVQDCRVDVRPLAVKVTDEHIRSDPGLADSRDVLIGDCIFDFTEDLHILIYYKEAIRTCFYRGFPPGQLAMVYRVDTELMRAFVNEELGLEFDSDWGKTLPGLELRQRAKAPEKQPLRIADGTCPFDPTPAHPARSLPTPKPSRKDGKDRGAIRLKVRRSNQRRLF